MIMGTNFKKSVFKILQEAACQLENKKQVKNALKYIKQHFKVDTYALSFDAYQSMTGLESSTAFIIILEKAGYKIIQDKITRRLMILPKTTKRRS